MHSTPTAGMQILLGLRPIEIELKAVAIATSVRLLRTGHWMSNGSIINSHATLIDKIREEIPDLNFPLDRSNARVRIKSNFKTVIGQKNELTTIRVRPRPMLCNEINCFTDGSKSESGSGAAFYMLGNDDQLRGFKKQESIHLGMNATVFQTEITAISRAAIAMLEDEVQNMVINFYIDSQSAIMALKSYTVRLKSVADCKRYLNKLGESNYEVTLNWMPGHVGQPGNTIADHLAKRGTELEDLGIEPRIPVSESVIKSQIKSWKMQEHTREWHRRTDCR